MLIGLVVGYLFYLWGATGLAYVVWVLAVVIGLVTMGSESARSGIGRFFALLGHYLGWMLGVALLTPVFIIGFSLAHCLSWLTGSDPLHLRKSPLPTYWLPADTDRRKVRHIRSLFATEILVGKKSKRLLGLTCLALLILAGETYLRSRGYGNAVLYMPASEVGYYPAPNQSVMRYGGLVETNRFGMRAPDFPDEKRLGTFRIFMMGDSTLWGGSYLDQSEIYPRLLQDALNEKFGDDNKRVEVLNIAANGWGPFHEMGYLKQFGAFDADMAILCLPAGDIYRAYYDLTDLPYFTVKSPPRLAWEEVFRHLNWRSRKLWKKLPAEEELHANGRRGIEKYCEIAEKLRSMGCHVLMEVLPSRSSGLGGEMTDEEEFSLAGLQQRMTEAGFVVGYPAGLFEGKGSAKELYRDKVHLQRVGHQVYTDYLLERLPQQSVQLQEWAGSQSSARVAEGHK